MKINGVVHMSFPIGIIKVFTDSPSQPQLSFCIKNVQRMSNMELNSMISKYVLCCFVQYIFHRMELNSMIYKCVHCCFVQYVSRHMEPNSMISKCVLCCFVQYILHHIALNSMISKCVLCCFVQYIFCYFFCM